jgi:hypothetical protein
MRLSQLHQGRVTEEGRRVRPISLIYAPSLLPSISNPKTDPLEEAHILVGELLFHRFRLEAAVEE